MSSPFTVCTPSIPERWARLKECGDTVLAAGVLLGACGGNWCGGVWWPH